MEHRTQVQIWGYWATYAPPLVGPGRQFENHWHIDDVQDFEQLSRSRRQENTISKTEMDAHPNLKMRTKLITHIKCNLLIDRVGWSMSKSNHQARVTSVSFVALIALRQDDQRACGTFNKSQRRARSDEDDELMQDMSNVRI